MNIKQLSRRLDSLTDRELEKLAEIYSETGQHKKGALIDSEMERRAEQGSPEPGEVSHRQESLL